jgi:hypothetical protein
MKPVTTETTINGKRYLVTAECSPKATETLEKKLERLILRHATDKKSYQFSDDIQLDKCS